MTDDSTGQFDTNLAYVWSPEDKTSREAYLRIKDALKQQVLPTIQVLPEVHCWVALPQTREVIDLTTSGFADEFERLTGQRAPADRPPPPYFWGTSDITKQYAPEEEACEMLFLLGLRIFREQQPHLAALLRDHFFFTTEHARQLRAA
jgi:hypothetical protein